MSDSVISDMLNMSLFQMSNIFVLYCWFNTKGENWRGHLFASIYLYKECVSERKGTQSCRCLHEVLYAIMMNNVQDGAPV